MFDQSGWHPWLRPIWMRESWSNAARTVRTKLQSWPLDEVLLYGLMLIVLVAALTGCATLSTPPTEPARNPQPPQLSEPLPSESYLQQAQKLIESWRSAVIGM